MISLCDSCERMPDEWVVVIPRVLTTVVGVGTPSRRQLDLVVDVAVCVLALVAGLARDAGRLGWTSGESPEPAYLFSVGPSTIVTCHLVGAVLLLARRRFPFAVAAALAALSLIVPLISAVLVTYAVARFGKRLPAVVTANAVVLVALLLGGDLLGQVGSTNWQDGEPYTLMLAVVTLTALGLYFRARGQLVAVLAERAEQAEREAEASAELARLRERADLAVRLHDDVTADLTVVTMAAGGLAVDGPDEGTRAEAEVVRAAGARALGSLHLLIRALSGEDVEQAAAPDADEATAVGVPARASARRHLLLDVLHEALLNADKHAAGTWVRVGAAEGRGGEHPDVLVVVNGPTPAQGEVRAPGTGTGLRSLRQRAQSLGGQLNAGPTDDGGWRTAVVLPTTALGAQSPESLPRKGISS